MCFAADKHATFHPFPWRLDRAPLYVRCFVTLFFCVVGLGLVVAEINLVLSHRLADGDPGFSFDDIVADLHGYAGARPLVHALHGPMRQYVKTEEEAETIIAWAEADGPEREYRIRIVDIIEARCLKCHSSGGESANPKISVIFW